MNPTIDHALPLRRAEARDTQKPSWTLLARISDGLLEVRLPNGKPGCLATGSTA